MRSTFALAAVFISIAVSVRSQSPAPAAITIAGKDAAVPGLPADRPAVEPHLAASPVDAGHLLGAAIIADAAAAFGPSQTCSSIVTFDAGRTWKTHAFDLQSCGDPWVAIGWDGDAWFSALGQRTGATGHRLYLYRSQDGGRTWPDPPVDFGTGQDHQTLLVGRPAFGDRGMVYVLSGVGGRGGGLATFRVFVGRSQDRGRTWMPPLVLSPSNLNMNTLAGAVLDDGTLLVPFIDSMRPPFNDMSGRLARRRVWTYQITNGGADVSPPLLISEDCASGHGFPSLVAVPGSTRTLFVCGGSSGQGVVLHTSDTSGVLWSPAVPIDAAGAEVVQRTASAAAGPSGTVAVTWLDSREAGKDCLRLRGVASSDGGRTFSPSQVLSTAPSCPQVQGNGAAAKRWPYNGDYSGLAASSDGRFHALWADSRSGTYQLRFMTFAGR